MMKKWMSLLLALCMMIMVLPATAETATTETATETETTETAATETATTGTAATEDATTETAAAYAGSWNLCGMVENGIKYDAETVIGLMGNYHLTLNEDGTAFMLVEMVNDTMAGTWKEIPGGIAITINDQTQQAALTDDGLLYLTAGENASMIFAREDAEGTADAASGKEGGLGSLLNGLLGGGEGGEDTLKGVLDGLKEGGKNLMNGLKTKVGSLLIAIGTGMSDLGNKLSGGETEKSAPDAEGTDGTESEEPEISGEELSAMIEEMLGDQMVKNPYNNFIEIKSVDQIYGTWNLLAYSFGEKMLTLDVASDDGETMSETTIISENKVVSKLYVNNDISEESEDLVALEVKDGAVVITYDATNTVATVRLTEENVMVVEIDGLSMIYTAAAAEAK